MAFHPEGISNTPRCFMLGKAPAGWATWLFASIDIFIVVSLDFFVVNKWKYCAHFLSTEQIEETKSSLHKESQCEVAFLRGMQPN